MTIKRFDPAQPMDGEAHRLLGNFLDEIADGLVLARTERDRGLHETRKSIKKARALLKLLREADGEFYEAQNARLRDLARSLSGARDAAALVEAADRLVAEFPDDRSALEPLRDLLAKRRDAAVIDGDALRAAIEDGIKICAEARRAMVAWKLPATPKSAAKCLAEGVEANFSRLGKSLKRTREKVDDEDVHTLRKAVKAHWTQLGLLQDLWPEKVGARRRKLKALGELLGEHNDLAVLLDLLKQGELDLEPKLRRTVRRRVRSAKAKRAEKGLARARDLYKTRPRKDLARPFAKAMVEETDTPVAIHALGEAHL